MSFSSLETIQAVEQPPGDREEEHRDTEIEEIHRESPAFLNHVYHSSYQNGVKIDGRIVKNRSKLEARWNGR